MISEKSKRWTDKDESSNGQFRCGRVRSSDETAVMALEQRDTVIYTSEIGQPAMGGFCGRRKVV